VISLAAEAARRERHAPGAPRLWQETLLRKMPKSRKLLIATSLAFPAPAGNAGPPLWRAFALWAGLSRGLAELEPCTRAIPRTAQACAIIASSSTQQAVTLARRDGTRLDDTAKGAVFLGIRTIQKQGRGMVPLYAARVQDLGIDDFVMITSVKLV
jgi:hypothetical protein